VDCREFIDRLDDFLAGTSSAEERAAAALHLECCSDCRQLASILRERAPLEPPADLVEAVLARTSGATCRSARERLGDFVDGRLASVDTRLVGAHLDGCAECSALSSAMRRLAEDLPSLGERMPDDAFVAEVLARTSGRRRPVVWRAARLLRSWQAWTGRPRFALEAAYVGTCVLALLFAMPASPLAGVPGKALNLATVNPVAEVAGPVHSAWLATSDAVAGVSREVTDGGADLLASVKTRVGTIWNRLASEQEADETGDSPAPPEQGDSR